MSEDRNQRWGFSSERLAYWYLRLNGFLLLEDVNLHSDTGSQALTDIDIAAVRFMNRTENYIIPMPDDPKVCECSTLINLILLEVKSSTNRMNGPWTNREKENIHRALRFVGVVDEIRINEVAASLYETGVWTDNELVTIRMFTTGARYSNRMVIDETQQLLWDEVIDFIVKRFNDYTEQKADTGHWPIDGILLRDLSLNNEIGDSERRLLISYLFRLGRTVRRHGRQEN